MKKRVKNTKNLKRHSRRKIFEQHLVHHLIQNERITTTKRRAKQAQRALAKVITVAKRKKEPNLTRELRKRLPLESVKKVKEELLPRFYERQGGYTRIMKLEPRPSDGAAMAIIELIQPEE